MQKRDLSAEAIVNYFVSVKLGLNHNRNETDFTKKKASMYGGGENIGLNFNHMLFPTPTYYAHDVSFPISE